MKVRQYYSHWDEVALKSIEFVEYDDGKKVSYLQYLKDKADWLDDKVASKSVKSVKYNNGEEVSFLQYLEEYAKWNR